MKIVLIAFLLFGCSRLSLQETKKKEAKVAKVIEKDCPKPKTVVRTVIRPNKKQKCERVGLTLLDSYGDHFRIIGCKEKVDKINTKSIIDAIRILVN